MPTTSVATAAFTPHIELPENDRQPLLELLNGRLADTADLYSQIKRDHWNVKGPSFFQLYLFFNQLAAEVFPFMNLIAERATALGGVVLGTMRAAASSTLREYPAGATEVQRHIKALIDRYAVYAASIRKAIDVANEHHDPSTVDLLTRISRAVDEQAWFLEVQLQR
jgi:starvation-inducible DNA-binding protein